MLDPASAPVPNQPPTAAITADCTGFDCTFTGSGSTDPDGSITSYAWDFGDGTTDTAADPAVHTYGTAGDHTVTLTVTDDAGGTHQARTTVTVPVAAPAEAIEFVGANIANANATRHSVVVPEAVREGDGLLLLFAENTSATISDPSGWEVLDTVSAGSSTVRVWRRVAGPDDAGSTITVDVSAISKAGLTVAAYRGTSLTDPVAAFARDAFSSSSVSRTTPVAPVAGERSWAVSYWTHKDSSTSALTPPDGVSVRASGSQTSGGRVTTLLADSGAMVPAGSYGGLTATGAAASSSASTWTIVLAPQA